MLDANASFRKFDDIRSGYITLFSGNSVVRDILAVFCLLSMLDVLCYSMLVEPMLDSKDRYWF